MNILSELKYYQKLSMLLERVIEESPCDPDITKSQIIAYKQLNQFKNNNTFVPKVEIQNVDTFLWPTFDDFWSAYDKKVGKKSKIKAKWLKLSQATKEEVMAYIPNYILSQPNKKYRLNPETFFNNDAWENELIFDKLPTVNGQTKEVIQKNLEQVPSSFIDDIRRG